VLTESGVKPRRIDSITCIALTILPGWFHWRDALVMLRPRAWSELEVVLGLSEFCGSLSALVNTGGMCFQQAAMAEGR
jgi:hypothetical protein